MCHVQPTAITQVTPAAIESERALILAPTGRDALLLAKTLNDAGIVTMVCPDVQAVCREIGVGAGLVLLADEVFSKASLEALSEQLAAQPAWSELPLIVLTVPGNTSRGSTMLAERLEPIANVTHLERPFRPLTLSSIVRTALRARRRQYEVRRLLALQEQAIADAQQTIRQRDQFLAMLGHELRNPLAAIVSCLALLDRLDWKPDAVARFRGVFGRQAHHLRRLVDDMLDVTRITRGIVTLDRASLDLVALVQRCAASIQPRFVEAGVALRFVPSGLPLLVDGDSLRLEQAVTNLLANAAKFTPRGGNVVLRVDRDAAGDARIDVTDTGVGIPADMLTHIFDVFAQAHVAIDRSLGGLGLGLTIVKHLVEMHGGSVVATSGGASQGSTFTIRLPAVHAEIPAMETLATATQKRQRILLVEDNPDVRALVSAILDTDGHEVEVAEDGPSGLAKALAFRPDVIVLDIGLPGFDGYEVARRLRAHGLSDVRLIALTGYGQAEDRKRALDAGFNVHLVKPVDPDRLSAIINDRVAA